MQADKLLVEQVRARCRRGVLRTRARALAHAPCAPRPRRRAPQTIQKSGLSTPEVEERRLKWGWNELAEKKVNPILQFLAYFWGPMPCMIWLAVAVEFIKGVLGERGARARGAGLVCGAQQTLPLPPYAPLAPSPFSPPPLAQATRRRGRTLSC